MSFSRIIRIGVASALAGILSACGGGGSSSSCPSTNPNCEDDLLALNGLGADGPLAQALVTVHTLEDFIANPATAANQLTRSDVRSNDEGLANDLILGRGVSANQYVLRFTVDAQTRDTTTGATGTDIPFSEVYTIVDANRLSQIDPNDPTATPTGRFYATALTKLAVDIAIAQGTLGAGTAGDLDASLAAAAQSALQIFGFGADVTLPLFGDSAVAIPPILDETTEGNDTRTLNVAAYRLALEMYAQLVENLVNDGSNGFGSDVDITAEILTQLSGDGQLDVAAGAPATDEEFLVDAINRAGEDLDVPQDGNDLLAQRFGGQDLLDVLVGDGIDGVTQEQSDIPAGVAGTIAGTFPIPSDFDGDGADNLNDDQPNNGSVINDMDSDGVDDATDNCPTIPNGPLIPGIFGENQTNTDGVGGGDSCDPDADGDGVNGPAATPAGTDADDQDRNVAVDADGDGWDDIGGPNAINFFNFDHPEGRGTPDNCVVGDPDAVNGGLLDATSAANPSQENLDFVIDSTGDFVINGTGQFDRGNGLETVASMGDDLGDICDSDQDGDGEDRMDQGGPDNDDRDPFVLGGDVDSDLVGNSTDNCPTTANPTPQTAGSTDAEGDIIANTPFGIACDPDDDGYPSTSQDIPGVTGEIGEAAPVDNCITVANGVALDDQANGDGDAFGDACDSDNDNDGLNEDAGFDPDSLNAASTYRVDVFTTRQSSATNEFRLETLSETSLLAAGAGVVDATLTLASSGTTDPQGFSDIGGAGTGDVDVATGYQTAVNALEFSGASGLGAATTTDPSGQAIAGNAVSKPGSATYAEPVLTVDTAGLSPWGNNSFVGAGRVTLDAAFGNPSATAEASQSLTAMLFSDGVHADMDLNGDYGFVDLSVTYDDTDVTSSLVNTTSRVFEANLDGAGAMAVTATATNSDLEQYDVAVGNADGSVSYVTTDLGVAAQTYSVTGTGIVDLNFTSGTINGVADSAGELISISENGRVGYGVKLDTSMTAAQLVTDLDGRTFSLAGLVIQPELNHVLGYDLLGGSIAFTEQPSGDLTVSFIFAGDQRDSSDYVAGDTALPTVNVGSIGSLSSLGNSEEFSIAANGRFERITFGSAAGDGSSQRPVELEGFYVPGKGLLLRYIETNFVEVGSGGTSVQFFCGNAPADLPSGFQFVDPGSGNAVLDPQPTGFVCGFISGTSSGRLNKMVQFARDNAGVSQGFSARATSEGGTISDATNDADANQAGIGQGILWGFPQ